MSALLGLDLDETDLYNRFFADTWLAWAEQQLEWARKQAAAAKKRARKPPAEGSEE